MPLILSIFFGLRSSPLGMLGYQGWAVELGGEPEYRKKTSSKCHKWTLPWQNAQSCVVAKMPRPPLKASTAAGVSFFKMARSAAVGASRATSTHSFQLSDIVDSACSFSHHTCQYMKERNKSGSLHPPNRRDSSWISLHKSSRGERKFLETSCKRAASVSWKALLQSDQFLAS